MISHVRNLPPWPSAPLPLAIQRAIYGRPAPTEVHGFQLVRRALAVIEEEEQKLKLEKPRK